MTLIANIAMAVFFAIVCACRLGVLVNVKPVSS
jgi:hypothetical protein